jgi:hypothetical protein
MPVLFLILFIHALAARLQGSTPRHSPTPGQEAPEPQNKTEKAPVPRATSAAAWGKWSWSDPDDAFLDLRRVDRENQKEQGKRYDQLHCVEARHRKSGLAGRDAVHP